MGLAWLFRWRRKPAANPAAGADPAEELKRKLADARAAEPGPEGEPEPEAPLEDRRRAVHERARAAIESMRGEGKAESDRAAEGSGKQTQFDSRKAATNGAATTAREGDQEPQTKT